MTTFIGEGMLLTLADFSLIVIGGFMTQIISKIMASKPLKKALGPLMPARQRSAFKPRNNNKQWPAFLGGVIIFFIIVFATKFLPVITPSWFPL